MWQAGSAALRGPNESTEEGDEGAAAGAAGGELFNPLTDTKYQFERVPLGKESDNAKDINACWAIINGKLPPVAQTTSFSYYTVDPLVMKDIHHSGRLYRVCEIENPDMAVGAAIIGGIISSTNGDQTALLVELIRAADVPDALYLMLQGLLHKALTDGQDAVVCCMPSTDEIDATCAGAGYFRLAEPEYMYEFKPPAAATSFLATRPNVEDRRKMRAPAIPRAFGSIV
jgi:hypothetical protein